MIRAFSWAVALILGAVVAHADDATCRQQEEEGLRALKASLVIPQLAACYGASDEDQSLTSGIRALTDNGRDDAKLRMALGKLANEVMSDGVYGAQADRDAYAGLARRAADDIAHGIGAGHGGTNIPVWQVSNGATAALPNVNVVVLLDGACPTPADATRPACVLMINSSKAWLRVFQLTERTLNVYAQPAVEALLERSTARLAMWHSYRDEALPQFPWEWMLNSLRLDKADKGPNGRKRDANGQPIGPMAPPTDQIILLHPGVGLEYRDKPDDPNASADSKTAPILYLELLGRNRWSWNEETGEMIGGGGVSLVATYADRDDTKIGYGLLFHGRGLGNYTLGITRSGDRTNLIFNTDLAEYFKDKLAYWKNADANGAGAP